MKKQFVDPKVTKCEQPLDKVTMNFGGYGCNDGGNDRVGREHRGGKRPPFQAS